MKNDKVSKFIIKSIIPFERNEKLPVVLLLHGMNVSGINDPRIVHLAKSLSILGYNVITPEIPEIKNFLINDTTLNSINTFFDLFKSNFINEKVGLFLISFSGGLSLISISEPKYKNFFKSILSLGSYSNFETTINYVLNNFKYDSYGAYILLFNYLDLIFKSNKLKAYFHDNIIYDSFKNPNYLKTKNNLLKDEISFCDKLENDLSFRLEIGEEIINKKKDLVKRLSPISDIYHFDSNSKIHLLHGKQDKIISSQESINLYHKIKDSNNCKLLLTDLISHGDSSNKILNFLEFPSLIYFFNDFLFSINE